MRDTTRNSKINIYSEANLFENYYQNEDINLYTMQAYIFADYSSSISLNIKPKVSYDLQTTQISSSFRRLGIGILFKLISYFTNRKSKSSAFFYETFINYGEIKNEITFDFQLHYRTQTKSTSA